MNLHRKRGVINLQAYRNTTNIYPCRHMKIPEIDCVCTHVCDDGTLNIFSARVKVRSTRNLLWCPLEIFLLSLLEHQMNLILLMIIGWVMKIITPNSCYLLHNIAPERLVISVAATYHQTRSHPFRNNKILKTDPGGELNSGFQWEHCQLHKGIFYLRTLFIGSFFWNGFIFYSKTAMYE